jgi:REP element-mobilizing transposase RayT
MFCRSGFSREPPPRKHYFDQDSPISIPATVAQNRNMGTHIYHGRQLRKFRISLVGHAYMITTCCNERTPLFQNIGLGEIVVDELRLSDDENRTDTFAYVVMPDHLHWLFQLQERNSLASVVRLAKGRSAFRVNQSRKQAGPVWQRGYHDRLVSATIWSTTRCERDW